MTNHEKRTLVAELLQGNTDALRAYQGRLAVKDLDGRIIIDYRQVGGSIELIERGGQKAKITPEEFDRFPVNSRVVVIDTAGDYTIPDPDDDYSEFNELN